MLMKYLLRLGAVLLSMAWINAFAIDQVGVQRWATSPLSAVPPNKFKCTMVNTGHSPVTLAIQIKDSMTGAPISFPAPTIRTLAPMTGATVNALTTYFGRMAYCEVTEINNNAGCCECGVEGEPSIRGNIQIDTPKSGYGDTTGALSELWELPLVCGG